MSQVGWRPSQVGLKLLGSSGVELSLKNPGATVIHSTAYLMASLGLPAKDRNTKTKQTIKVQNKGKTNLIRSKDATRGSWPYYILGTRSY